MNTKQFSILFFVVASFAVANALFGTLSTVTYNSGLFLPLLSATGGSLGTVLAALGALKIGAIAVLLASQLKGGAQPQEQGGYGAPEPGYGAPQESYGEPAPSYGAPAEPAPSYDAPAPSYDAPAPSYDAPAPSYDAPAEPAPSYDAPAPAYDAPAPSYNGYRSHRTKRALDVAAFGTDPDAVFQLVAAMDVYDCAKRLVCELEAKPEVLRTAEESLMISFHGKGHFRKVNPASAKGEYDLASQLGQATKSQMYCRKRYQKCPYTADLMMNALANSKL